MAPKRNPRPVPQRPPSAPAAIDPNAIVQSELENAYLLAESAFISQTKPTGTLSKRMIDAIDKLSALSHQETTGFTNIINALAVKCGFPTADVRYHKKEMQKQTTRPAGFGFRVVSEKATAPWLSGKRFNCAKSGFQTRVYERTTPYTLDYPENISNIKEPFLAIYDELEEHGANARESLVLAIYHQLVYRDSRQITLAVPRTGDISQIVALLDRHFHARYSAKGQSRLPVLAIQAVYSEIVEQVSRFRDKQLLPLQEHSAADAQTGSAGDIQVVDSTGTIVEAAEVKHDIAVTKEMVLDLRQKLMDKQVDRYYILTTHRSCRPDGAEEAISEISQLFGCQIICNGVLPTLAYYLRLLDDPSRFCRAYVKLLESDKAVHFEHRSEWNRLCGA
jgi:DNA (cytosine-5)-methyltransferase 1